MSEAQKFGFDTVFDGAGAITATSQRPKRLFPIEEVEQIRKAAYAEGERAALASVAAQQAGALAQIADACGQALPRLAEVAHNHRSSSAALALACGRAIADAALDRFPDAAAKAALDSLAREIEAQPRLTVSTDPAIAETVQATLTETARNLGFEGAIVVRPDGAYGRHAFTLDFGDGHATFDPQASAQRVTQALEAALAAEGLHAEPMIPGSES